MTEYTKDRLGDVISKFVILLLAVVLGILALFLMRFVLIVCLNLIIPDDVVFLLKDDGEIDAKLTYESLQELSNDLLELKKALYDKVFYWFYTIIFVISVFVGYLLGSTRRSFTLRDFVLKIDNEHDAYYVLDQTERLIAKRGWGTKKNK